VNGGQHRAIVTLQRVLGIDADGQWGPKTDDAVTTLIAAGNIPKAIEDFKNQREAFYCSLPTARYFLKDWLRRSEEVEKQPAAMEAEPDTLDKALDDFTKNAPTPIMKPQAAFYAEKLGVSQTGLITGSYNAVTWPSTYFNVGEYFDTNNWWTPPAGFVQMEAMVWQPSDAATTGSPTFLAKILRFNNSGNVTISNASPAVVHYPNHLFIAGQPVQFSATALTSPLVNITVYCVSSVIDANNFTISNNVSGVCTPDLKPINTATAGSGLINGFSDACGDPSTAFVGYSGTTAQASSIATCTAHSNGTDHFIVNYFTNSSDGANNGVIDGNPAHTHWSGHSLDW
jgi:hypothetical protein